MQPRLSIVTLGVADLARARAFYCDVLGWTPAPQSAGDILFFQAGGVVLALYPRPLLADEAGVDAAGSGFGGFTLAQNVRERADVDRILAEVAAGGARIIRPAADAFWGGRSGYFADPDGNPWEVAWNPGFRLDRRGILQLERRAARGRVAPRRSGRPPGGRRRAIRSPGTR